MIRTRLARAGCAALFTLLVTAGCTQTKSFRTSQGLAPGGSIARILLMPADVEVSELTAAGLLEPNAQWTQQGSRNIGTALRAVLGARGKELVEYRVGDDPLSVVSPEHQQIFKLHEAVGRSILVHKYIQGFELPTKKDRFDWTLGTGARSLMQSYGTDYALFVYARDSFASAGRVALIFTAALFGVAVPGGHQEAFASLIDLKSGDIVWFNVMARGVGDLREPDSARVAVESLLSNLPL